MMKLGQVILAAEEERHGVVSIQRPEAPDREWIKGKLFALNLYRLMYDGHLQGVARQLPFTATFSGEGQMTLTWLPTERHPFHLEAAYKVLEESGEIELRVTVEAAAPLRAFELSISSYFDFWLEPYALIPSWPGKTADEELRLVKLEDHPLIKGHYLFFPRDNEAGRTLRDGRWFNPATGKPIAQFVTGPAYGKGKALAVMASPQAHVAQTVRSDSCSGIILTYFSEDKTDSIYRHNAIYFTLFGEDLQPGDRREATIWQRIAPGEPQRDDLLSWCAQRTEL